MLEYCQAKFQDSRFGQSKETGKRPKGAHFFWPNCTVRPSSQNSEITIITLRKIEHMTHRARSWAKMSTSSGMYVGSDDYGGALAVK